jgi:molecular chaperone HtpG
MTLKAETSRLLELVIHSLYTKHEIFLRELISNASDALDRLSLEALTDPDRLTPGETLEIHLDVDPAARRLTIRDNGIGMSRAEVIDHIGTIARSGTSEFAATLTSAERQARALDLIGRFGVGFYSSFMVATKVTVLTRREGEARGTRWESAGDIHYQITDADDVPRGTSVILELKPAAETDGVDYTDRWVLGRIVKRYADFVAHPIVYLGPAPDAALAEGDIAATTPSRAVLNSQKPIWTRPEAEVSAEAYAEFYRHISHDGTEPLRRMSFRAEGRWEYHALLFVPSQAPYDLYYHAAPFGLQLYAQRMLIIEASQELLPRYLRFLKGVVDGSDLPLNVSRDSLQHAHHMTAIRRWLTRKVLDAFSKLREQDAETYTKLWTQFGRALKEGVSEDYDNKDRLVSLLLFESSAHPSHRTTLSEYVQRMKPEQAEILYLTGTSRGQIERSPHVEQVLARGYELLYLTEPVDELVVQSLTEFEQRPLRSVATSTLDLGAAPATPEAPDDEIPEGKFNRAVAAIAAHLGSRVHAVTLSRRLTTSPACLTNAEFAYSPHIERLLRAGQEGDSTHRRTLELNPRHAILRALHQRVERDPTDPAIALAADLLLGWAVLAEGSTLSDPAAFTGRLSELLVTALGSREDAMTVPGSS